MWLLRECHCFSMSEYHISLSSPRGSLAIEIHTDVS